MNVEIRSKEPSVFAKIYFSDLTSVRLYAALSSFVWAIVISSSDAVWYSLNWNFIHPPIRQQSFSLLLLAMSLSQLVLINSASSKWARLLDSVVYGFYLVFWAFAALYTSFILDVFSQALVANHFLLAFLGFWIFSRGFSSLKT